MGAYDRRWWRGVLLDEVTIAALEWAEAGWSKPGNVGAGQKIQPSQGSYNAGGVAASAGTHDGGGAVDIKTLHLTTVQRRRLVRWLRRAGFAAWFRPAVAGLWGPHVHAILLDHPHASAGAKAQMVAYRNGRNGLANNGPDVGWRPDPIPTFDYDLGVPVKPGAKPLKRTAPKGMRLTVTELTSGASPSPAVQSLQVALKRQGPGFRALHPSPTDGLLGDGTKAMIKRAQARIGAKPTGRPTVALLTALGYESAAAAAKRKPKRKAA